MVFPRGTILLIMHEIFGFYKVYVKKQTRTFKI